MEVYQVGGAVRDELLGLPVQDRDFVVVGASPEQLLALGYRPVGKDFPVFLHPRTHEEYALARTERKTAPGYKGFIFHAAPDVTLEQDLARRDLTINAIAKTGDGTLVDPFGGVRDLRARVLRHVGAAFAEDPVRILRVARFAARFDDFTLAPETAELMRSMTEAGEVDHLVAERVWQELSRGLMEARPSRMIEVLRGCGALSRLLPELDRLFGVPGSDGADPRTDAGAHLMRAIDAAATAGLALPVRFAALMIDAGKALPPPAERPSRRSHGAHDVQAVEAVCARLRVPGDCRDLAVLAARERAVVACAEQMDAAEMVELLERCDALRRPARFRDLLDACACDFKARSGGGSLPYPPRAILLGALEAAASIDAGAVARAAADPARIAASIRAARLAAVRARRRDC